MRRASGFPSRLRQSGCREFLKRRRSPGGNSGIDPECQPGKASGSPGIGSSAATGLGFRHSAHPSGDARAAHRRHSTASAPARAAWSPDEKSPPPPPCRRVARLRSPNPPSTSAAQGSGTGKIALDPGRPDACGRWREVWLQPSDRYRFLSTGRDSTLEAAPKGVKSSRIYGLLNRGWYPPRLVAFGEIDAFFSVDRVGPDPVVLRRNDCRPQERGRALKGAD